MVIEEIFYIALYQACLAHHTLAHADDLKLFLYLSRCPVRVCSLAIEVNFAGTSKRILFNTVITALLRERHRIPLFHFYFKSV